MLSALVQIMVSDERVEFCQKPNKARIPRVGFMCPVSGRQTCRECDIIESAQSFEAALTTTCGGSPRQLLMEGVQADAGRGAHEIPELDASGWRAYGSARRKIDTENLDCGGTPIMKMRCITLPCTIAASASIILVTVAASSNAQEVKAISSAAPVPPVANPCPRPEAGVWCGTRSRFSAPKGC